MVVVATGGTITYTDPNGLNPRSSPPYSSGYKVHKFTSDSSFVVTTAGDVEYLVVAGGGGGGKWNGGGGGAGGFRTGVLTLSTGSKTVTVGNGGSGYKGATDGPGSNGVDSVFDSITSAGGGGGGGGGSNGVAGGSGGGGGNNPAGGYVQAAGNTPSTSPSQGYAGGSGQQAAAGYPAGGGGGAGGIGGNNTSTVVAGNGGLGQASSISGVSTYYAGGGGAGISTGTAGIGGSSIGGTGGVAATGSNGVVNTGSGGGGGGYLNPGGHGGDGGSGIVIVRYPTPFIPPPKATGGTESIVSGYKIHKFTTSGTFTVTTAGDIEVLVVAGGGSGGCRHGGGGGAGGVVYNAASSVTTQSYTVTIGDGGTAVSAQSANGNTGQDSSVGNLVIAKGGGGGGAVAVGNNGGSGGGGGYSGITAGTAVAGFGGTTHGYAGGTGYGSSPYGGGGGGGAGAAGGAAGGVSGAGGAGISTYSSLLIDANAGVDISGTHWIAGGGGGGQYYAGGAIGAGGNGGGGAGGYSSNTATSGTVNTGGGGGGSGGESSLNGISGVGGTGIVIIRYPVSLYVITNVPTSPQETSCTLNGNISALTGSQTVDVRGFCYKVSSSGDPTLSDSHVEDTAGGYGTGAYTKDITGLSVGTTYKVRAYATDASETVYGTTVTFSTLGTVETDPCSFASWNSILANGDLVSAGASSVLGCGFCYKVGDSGDPTTSDSTVSIAGDATGGTMVYTDSSGLNPRSSPPYSGGYTVHKFLLADSGTNFTARCSHDVEYLVVAGGGGGAYCYGGGGGAGGFRTGTLSVTAASYAITVGDGGAAGNASVNDGQSGGSSIFSTITSAGGGGGAHAVGNAKTGGSGGGGQGLPNSYGGSYLGAAGNTPSTSPSQGTSGGNGAASVSGVRGAGGGGGATSAGSNGTTGVGGSGGNGTSSSISGTATTYAGGGGGGVFSDAGTTYPGGSGGGGASAGNSVAAIAGTSNTGGGGGGGTQQASSPNPITVGAKGGSGIVIIRYPSRTAPTVGEFSIPITGLAKETSYRIRAYATNSDGTFYGSSITNATLARTLGNVSRIIEIDYMEYVTDALAQLNYVSNSSANLQAYAEATIKTQGSGSLKCVATITDSLNKTLTRTLTGVDNIINIPYCTSLYFDIRASRTGSNIKIGLHDSGGTVTEITPNITVADAWQAVTWDISAVANTNKDAIDSIIITVVNADAANTFYIDNFIVVGSASASNIFGWII